MVHVHDKLYLLLVDIMLETAKHAIESDFGRVRYEREHRVVNILVDGLKYCRYELFAKLFAFLIDVPVGTTTEIYPLERAI